MLNQNLLGVFSSRPSSLGRSNTTINCDGCGICRKQLLWLQQKLSEANENEISINLLERWDKWFQLYVTITHFYIEKSLVVLFSLRRGARYSRTGKLCKTIVRFYRFIRLSMCKLLRLQSNCHMFASLLVLELFFLFFSYFHYPCFSFSCVAYPSCFHFLLNA